MNQRTRQPMIHIYLDKETGKPKGEATVSYEDPPTAKTAMEWFDGKDFQGSKLKVSLARKNPPMNSMWDGMPPRVGSGMPPPTTLWSSRWPRRSWRTHGLRRRFVEETEEASLQEGHKAPEGTLLEEETSSTELETGSVSIQAVETRSSLGEQNATSIRPLSPRATSRHRFFHLRMVILTEAALVACEKEKAYSWTVAVLEECSEVAEVETGGFRSGHGMDGGGFGGGRRGGPGGPPRPLMEQMGGGRGGRGRPRKMAKGEHHQERRDRPYYRDRPY